MSIKEYLNNVNVFALKNCFKFKFDIHSHIVNANKCIRIIATVKLGLSITTNSNRIV